MGARLMAPLESRNPSVEMYAYVPQVLISRHSDSFPGTKATSVGCAGSVISTKMVPVTSPTMAYSLPPAEYPQDAEYFECVSSRERSVARFPAEVISADAGADATRSRTRPMVIVRIRMIPLPCPARRKGRKRRTEDCRDVRPGRAAGARTIARSPGNLRSGSSRDHRAELRPLFTVNPGYGQVGDGRREASRCQLPPGEGNREKSRLR